ncbi:MAG TPA: carboxypeptidase-like regulatory domain-containing protein, partial [Vicinamibacterales bacterium]|nr:carboxypeptidase-like regulatory domain-containing protein [Vicinamibacterales bacterium]
MPALAALSIATQSGTPPQGTIRGRVLDPDGRPMPGVQITALEMVTERTSRNLGVTVSGEDGAFEIAILPRQIFLMARPGVRLVNRQPAPPQHYPPAYFPGVLDRLDAWPIDVKPGEIIELDFQMPPVFVGSIKTVVSGPAGYSLEQVRVMRPEANQIRNVKVLEDGIGYVDSLREGRYIVSARGRSSDTPLAAWEIVQMTAGEIAVTLDLKPTAKVYG